MSDLEYKKQLSILSVTMKRNVDFVRNLGFAIGGLTAAVLAATHSGLASQIAGIIILASSVFFGVYIAMASLHWLIDSGLYTPRRRDALLILVLAIVGVCILLCLMSSKDHQGQDAQICPAHVRPQPPQLPRGLLAAA